MARIVVWPGSVKAKYWHWPIRRWASAASKKSAVRSGMASSWIVNRNSSSVYNTGSTNNVATKKPASLTSKIGANKVVTKRR